MHQQLAWYIGGPVVGLCVVALRWLLNERLGATGAWSDVVERASGRSPALGTPRLAAARADLRRDRVRAVRLEPRRLRLADGQLQRLGVVAILAASGVLIGYGAKPAGGCTSGNGLSGNAILSPAALVSTGTFFGTAILVSFVTEALI